MLRVQCGAGTAQRLVRSELALLMMRRSHPVSIYIHQTPRAVEAPKFMYGGKAHFDKLSDYQIELKVVR